MTRTRPFLTLVLAVLVVGCAARQKEVLQEIEKANEQPVQCATAEGDIRVLEAERAHTASRVAQGVTAVFPAGAVIGILSGTYTTKVKIAAGRYNKAIDERIATIREACDLPEEGETAEEPESDAG